MRTPTQMTLWEHCYMPGGRAKEAGKVAGCHESLVLCAPAIRIKALFAQRCSVDLRLPCWA